MERKEIEEKVREFLIDEFEIDETKISPDTRLKEDIGIDSLDYVDIVVIVSKVFGCKIQAGDLTDVKTFSQFCDYIEQKLNN